MCPYMLTLAVCARVRIPGSESNVATSPQHICCTSNPSPLWRVLTPDKGVSVVQVRRAACGA